MNGFDLYRIAGWALVTALLASCNAPTGAPPDALFRLHGPDRTGIDFVNQLDYTETLNPYTFKSFYNGGGVGLGDFNNDGLPDIFFTGNLVSNRLYLNEGNFKFKDITAAAGVGSAGVWSTGVSIADINGDGWLDIYVCKSGPPGGSRRKNELFINNGDLTFTEAAAQYALDFEGLSVHAAFFDFDKDGDLDGYLLNNSLRSVGGYDLRKDQRNIPDTLGGNKLLRNDNNVFVDVSADAGIYTSEIGFGLGVTVGDINNDGWPDMFVSNDFFEKDYLYVNNRNGTFRECLEEFMNEISLGSMGADMADLNNDGYPEIYVTEMLPEHDDRLKTKAQFENWDKFIHSYRMGYWKQFGRNVLQLNNGDGSFSEISRYSGVDATDWSWGALIFDMDNDGRKDIFVANGIYKDLVDQDYVSFVANASMIRDILKSERQVIRRLVDSIPSTPIANYAFRNDGNLMFSNQTAHWGLDEPSFANGSAYGDLDNDGDPDLVLNNVNMPASIYENRAAQQSGNHAITVSLRNTGTNTYALGAKVTLHEKEKMFHQEVSPMRGFMSTVDTRLTFGIGTAVSVDSVVVIWPDGTQTRKYNVPAGALTVDRRTDSAHTNTVAPRPAAPLFRAASVYGVGFSHEENDYNDFNRDRLLFNMASNEGPCFCKGDINGDGREDFYVGGAKGQAGAMFVQHANGSFAALHIAALEADRGSEDTDCLFFDADGDGTQDLYVASGGSEFSPNSAELLSRLYFNRNGKWTKSRQALPSSTRFESSSTLSAADFDGDGDVDLFVGIRMLPFQYGVPASSYLLRNDGTGRFEDVTALLAPALQHVGLVTDSHWTDINRDNKPDLVLVGEWMPVKILIQEANGFSDRTSSFGLDSTEGWYHSIHVSDVNGDGWDDLVVGNHGLNSRFKASRQQPVSMYVNDFDQNGTLEQIITRYDKGKPYPFVLRGDLLAQLPGLKKKYLHYRDYHSKAMDDIFPPDVLEKSVTHRVHEMQSLVLLNGGGMRFTAQPLPWAAQLFPVYAITSDDFDGDGNTDLLIGGNLSRAKPETGLYEGGHGLMLTGNGDGSFTAMKPTDSGVRIVGEVRGLFPLEIDKKNVVVVVRNNDTLKFLTY